MVTWSGVVPAVKVGCSLAGPDTFVVKVNNATLPSVAIDAPANGQEFIDELEKAKSRVLNLSGGVPGGELPPAVLQDFLQYLTSTSAFVSIFSLSNQTAGPSSHSTPFFSLLFTDFSVGLCVRPRFSTVSQ